MIFFRLVSRFSVVIFSLSYLMFRGLSFEFLLSSGHFLFIPLDHVLDIRTFSVD